MFLTPRPTHPEPHPPPRPHPLPNPPTPSPTHPAPQPLPASILTAAPSSPQRPTLTPAPHPLPASTLTAPPPRPRAPPTPRPTLTAPHTHRAPPSPRPNLSPRPTLSPPSTLTASPGLARSSHRRPPFPSPPTIALSKSSNPESPSRASTLRVPRQPPHRCLSTPPEPLPSQIFQVTTMEFILGFSLLHGILLRFSEAGPGGLAGGGTWGAATDEMRVYTNIANSEAKNFTLAPSKMTTTTGGWVTMNSTNGKIIWSTANPSNSTSNGPVSVANEVVFVGSVDKMGSIYAINGKSGKILWSYKTGGSVYGGMSISNGCIYLGNGYTVSSGFPTLTGGTSLFAFCV
ncbi:hypothetical protein Fmac_017591 [Flemingia macrophylla]|uniref:Pyrrolo-quinoline quinone repeat domain-containing protein n=1 Tax=Flemingia macrophylla TaxID=520843 RepID=A0ABD1M2K8_9FABA